MTIAQDPRDAVTALADSTVPYLLGVRHHSPALAAAVPALLDASGAEVVCVELPTDFQPWLPHLADPGTQAPVALAGAHEGGRLGFYPFADFSPELAALRWARERGAEIVCCDLPIADPAWSGGGPIPGGEARDADGPGPADEKGGSDASGSAEDTQGADGSGQAGDGRNTNGSGSAGDTQGTGLPGSAHNTQGADGPRPAGDAHSANGPVGPAGLTRSAVAEVVPSVAPTAFAEALVAAGSGRDGDDLWDRCVEVLAPGCAPEAIRRAALGVGWALRRDAESAGGVPSVDLAREAHMRATIARAAAGGRRVAAVVGAFHAPALSDGLGGEEAGADGAVPAAPPAGTTSGSASAAQGAALVGEHPPVVTSLVPYAFDLLDSRSGYPAGIRDPRWQQAVFVAGGDPELLHGAPPPARSPMCAGSCARPGTRRERARPPRPYGWHATWPRCGGSRRPGGARCWRR
ncbi:DUF5682 family protein [Streptomyces ipomoeae]|uniref:DUF5682 family protein n=1 Tax=Streptomyces ipomoeae TaxID=103232 RepID=UPI0035A6F8D1